MADEGEGPPSSQAWIFPGLTGLIPMATPWSSIIQHSERLQRWTASPPPRPSTSCGNQQVTSSASVAERMLALPFTAELCGHVLARAHARTGDAVSIAAYLGKGRRFDAAMEAFAIAYADQTTADHRQLVDAIEAGAVPAQPG